ncbi:RNA polymerase factor sigma-32 [compost metagenome]
MIMMKSKGNALQLTYELPAVNNEATRKRVEEELDTVRIYRRIGIIRREAGTTSRYEPRVHGSTNTISKTTENHAVWNVDRELLMERKAVMMDKALMCLSELERDLIRQRYLDTDDTYDYLVCGDLGVSERKYRRVKAQAMYKLALALKLEVLA